MYNHEYYRKTEKQNSLSIYFMLIKRQIRLETTNKQGRRGHVLTSHERSSVMLMMVP